MKSLVLLIVVLLTASHTSDLGSGTAYLTCTSDSGRTKFYAELQDIDGLLEKAVLTIDSDSLSYETSDGRIIFDPKNGILTMYIDDYSNKSEESNHKFLQFWSVPSTFVDKSTSSGQLYEFKAKIYGSEPRKGKEFHTPKITLNCKLEYSI